MLQMNLSDSVAQSNQAAAFHASSSQSLNSHLLDLNAHFQIEPSINFSVKSPDETGNRNLLIHNASPKTNIIQEQQQPQ